MKKLFTTILCLFFIAAIFAQCTCSKDDNLFVYYKKDFQIGTGREITDKKVYFNICWVTTQNIGYYTPVYYNNGITCKEFPLIVLKGGMSPVGQSWMLVTSKEYWVLDIDEKSPNELIVNRYSKTDMNMLETWYFKNPKKID